MMSGHIMATELLTELTIPLPDSNLVLYMGVQKAFLDLEEGKVNVSTGQFTLYYLLCIALIFDDIDNYNMFLISWQQH